MTASALPVDSFPDNRVGALVLAPLAVTRVAMSPLIPL
jgi:hypothetical protein